MNGVHDVGGTHGFGPIVKDDAAFHSPWELRVRAIANALIRRGVYNIDEFRRAIECLPPAQYLSLTYFERWLAAVQVLLVEKGQLTADEIEGLPQTPAEDPTGVEHSRGSDDRAVTKTVMEAAQTPQAPAHATARFGVGDNVVARNRHTREHTRLPRYLRGKPGVVSKVHGVYVFPDTNAHGRGGNPQPVYSVRFAARDIWGDAAAPNDCLFIDLWESYLEPA